MGKIVVLEVAFEDDDDAEEFARRVKEEDVYLGGISVGDVIRVRVEDE